VQNEWYWVKSCLFWKVAVCCLRPMMRNSVLEELRVRRFADIQEEMCFRAVLRWATLDSKLRGWNEKKSWTQGRIFIFGWTWPSVSQEVITQRVSPAIFKVMNPNILGSRTWPYKVTWRHRSQCDHSISNMLFPIGVPQEPSLYLQLFLASLHPNTSGSRPWPLMVTWRYRSRGHLIPHVSFRIGTLL